MERIKHIDGNLYKFKSPPGEVASNATAESLFQEGLVAESRDDMDAAVHCYQEALRYDSHCSGALLNLGSIRSNQGDFVIAEWYYRKAIEIDPGYAMAHYDLANTLAERGRCREAVEHYRKAIAINPQYADAHYNLAVEYDNELREANLAVKHYRLYLRHQRNDDFMYVANARRRIRHLRNLAIVAGKSVVSDASGPQSDSGVA